MSIVFGSNWSSNYNLRNCKSWNYPKRMVAFKGDIPKWRGIRLNPFNLPRADSDGVPNSLYSHERHVCKELWRKYKREGS